MSRIAENKIEMVAVEFTKDDIRLAILQWAEREMRQGAYAHLKVDGNWAPQIVNDGYGGCTIYFRKGEPETTKKAAA